MIKGSISWYDVAMFIGLILTAIRMAVQYHLLKRVQVALHDAEADVERLKKKHPIAGDNHQPVPSPPDEIVAGRPNFVPKENP